jgi:hypothetical protein
MAWLSASSVRTFRVQYACKRWKLLIAQLSRLHCLLCYVLQAGKISPAEAAAVVPIAAGGGCAARQ